MDGLGMRGLPFHSRNAWRKEIDLKVSAGHGRASALSNSKLD